MAVNHANQPKAIRGRWMAAMGVSVGLVALMATGIVAFACSQYATLFTTEQDVQPGQPVTVKGYHFENGTTGAFGPVLIYWSGGALVGQVTPGANGSFVTTVTVPSNAQPGFYSITGQEWNKQHTVQEAGGYANAAMTIPSHQTGTGSSGGSTGTGQRTSGAGTGQAPSSGRQPVAQASAALAVSGDPIAPGTPASSASSAVSQPAAGADLKSRVVAREGSPASIGFALPNNPPLRVTMPTTQPGNSAMTGLAVGMITLAVGVPLVVMGFAVASTMRRRALAHSRADADRRPID